MKCPFCGFIDSRVIDSRPTDDGETIRRRRECLSCQRRFITYERIETIPISVLKRDGRREPFSREKIMKGLIKSTEKRPISISQLEDLVSEIEQRVSNSMAREVTSEQIGEYVMEILKKTDDVAYIRFAAVYRQFDIESFKNEIDSIIQRKD